jgi:hypothetical protein
MLLLHPEMYSYNSGNMSYHVRSHDPGQFVDREMQLSPSLSHMRVNSSSDFRSGDEPKCLKLTVVEFASCSHASIRD